MVTTWACRFLLLLRNIFFGTKVTPQRYGKDSWAVVTGSTDGIGKALALELAARGFNIALISRDSQKLANVAKEIQLKHKRDTRVIQFDFTEGSSYDAYLKIEK